MHKLEFITEDKVALLTLYVKMLPFELSKWTEAYYIGLLNTCKRDTVITITNTVDYTRIQSYIKELLYNELLFATKEGYVFNDKYFLEEPYIFTITGSIADKPKRKVKR